MMLSDVSTRSFLALAAALPRLQHDGIEAIDAGPWLFVTGFTMPMVR
jgi:hypothetical protein